MSRLPFELFLALRYLRPKRTFVSVITLISILGVALGVAVLIIVISVMSGFDHDMRDRILGFNAHLTVSQPGRTMNDYAAVARVVAQNKNVRGVSPFVMGPVLIKTQGGTNRASLQDAPMLRGSDPATESKVSKLPEQIKDGKFDLSGRGLVVGADFAFNLGLQVGDTISIYSAREIDKMRSAYERKEYETILPDDYEVRGIFQTGWNEYDAHVIVASLENAQDLYDLDESVHGLFVMINDPYQATVVKNELTNTLGGNFYVSTWMEQNSGRR
jgi:lipoprotein-releasing system permease protein